MAPVPTTRNSLTIVKSFGYRGSPEEWSNTYFFTGALPASPSSWKTLADAVIADEVTLYDSSCEVVRAIGHQAGQSIAVWSYDYLAASEEVPGTMTAGDPQSGDTAMWLRWSTDQLTSKGKPIFLRSYYHPARVTDLTVAGRDTIDTTVKTALQEFGDDWIAGYNDGDAVLHQRCGPKGAVGLVALPSSYATTRTLERRGKRP